MIFNTDLHLDIDNGVSLEKVDKFCYLGDMLFTDGECDSTETARVGPSVYSRPLWGKIPPQKKSTRPNRSLCLHPKHKNLPASPKIHF